MITLTLTTLDELERELRDCGVTVIGENGHRDFLCPLCAGQATALKNPQGSVTLTCDRCDIPLSELGARLETLRALAESGAHDVGRAPADALSKLLGLDAVGLAVVRARVVGRGTAATIYLHLSDGAEVVFERLGDFANPTRLAQHLCIETGAKPRLKVEQILDAIALIREMAELDVGATTDQLSRDWGTSYLQSTAVIDVDMSDQAERWKAFADLERMDPGIHANLRAVTVAQASVILRDTEGTRYVRCSWFRAHVRSEDGSVSPQEIAHRMERIGWRRRGGEGRIKATRPGHRGSLVWAFYTVPADWEDDQ